MNNESKLFVQNFMETRLSIIIKHAVKRLLNELYFGSFASFETILIKKSLHNLHSFKICFL